MAFLVPVFENVFKDFGGELPAITKFTVALSHLVTQQWYLLIGGTPASSTAFQKWKQTERGREQWDRFKLKVPMKIGDIVQKVAWRASRARFSALIARRRADARGDRDHRPDLGQQGHREGDGRRARLRASGRDDRRADGAGARGLPGDGRADGRRGRGDRRARDDAGKIADFYEDQVAAAVKALTSILEPVMIIVVGGIVGFIVIAMYMPMFKVYDSIK